MLDKPTRAGHWMQTYTGKQFWAIDPHPEEVCIEDIAAGLRMPRYNFQCIKYYSVAEHSVLLSEYVPDHLKRAALFHDASEAYLADIVRPVKPSLPGYYEIEDRLMRVIAERFGFAWPCPEFKQYDNRILIDEMQQNMAAPPADWAEQQVSFGVGDKPLGVKLRFWAPEAARCGFLYHYHKLCKAGL